MDEEPCRVLVCDDNRDAADAAVTLLQIWGHQAMTAYSAAQCIAVAKVFNPDIVLMDIGLPGKTASPSSANSTNTVPLLASSRLRVSRRLTLPGKHDTMGSRII